MRERAGGDGEKKGEERILRREDRYSTTNGNSESNSKRVKRLDYEIARWKEGR